MNLLEKYLSRTLIKALLLVSLLIMGLHVFLTFVGEINDVGKGDYQLRHVIIYVLLTLPYHFYRFFPILSLLAGLIGLGTLAHHHELVVMRSHGFSLKAIFITVFKFVMLCLIVVLFMGEVVAPVSKKWADSIKAVAKSGGTALQTAQGIWLRQGQQFIHIHEILPGERFKGISIYDFTRTMDLHQALFAGYAERKHASLNLYNIALTKFSNDKTETQMFSYLNWPIRFNPSLFAIVNVTPDSMNLPELIRYQRDMKQLHQNVDEINLSFWQRIMRPFNIIIMLILAVPFILGPLRSKTLASKLLIGILFGVGFYLLNEFFASFSLVWQISPFVSMLLPNLLLLLIIIFFTSRKHKL